MGEMGEWVILTKNGAFAPSGRVWYNSKEEAFKALPRFGRTKYRVKHKDELSDSDMRLVMEKQLERINKLGGLTNANGK